MRAPIENPIIPFIRAQGRIVLNGGLATTLEAHGHDLHDDLWSAKVLMEDPDAIRAVHRDFLTAGADCITTSTYQATFAGFSAKGLSVEAAERLLLRSVDLAVEARDAFWADPEHRPGRLRPLVAASVGPYGAFLADGSEYTGDYGIDSVELYDFHERRWQVLAESRVDLMACETIPSRSEAEVLLSLLQDTPDRWAWMSFSCRDGAHLNDGTRLEHVAELCAAEPRVAAVGINCTSPDHISSLIGEARKAKPKPIIVYPNSGERYDPVHKQWVSAPSETDWGVLADEWAELGAAGIGGCCRILPDDITKMRSSLLSPSPDGGMSSS